MAIRQVKITTRITERNATSLKNYFGEVSKFNLLKPEEEFYLANKIKEGDKKSLQLLVNSNLRFVISVAKQFQNQGIPMEDLISEGNIGLIKAAEKFDNTRGFKFISYAVWWIRQSIIQTIADHSRLVRIPNNQNAYIKKVNKSIIQLEQKLHREPTTDEIAALLEESDYKIKDIMSLTTKTVSLDCPVFEGENLYYIDFIANPSSKMPDNYSYQESMQHDLESTLNNLEWKQKLIICMSFGLCGYQVMTLEETGNYMNLSRERIRQIKESALKSLRVRKNSVLLKNYNG